MNHSCVYTRTGAVVKCRICGKSFTAGIHGAGTELHVLLQRFGLTASGDCKCTSRAAYLDKMGCDWAEANIAEIVGWLRESAAERGLPFLDVAGRVLVRRAIANARRKEQARAKEAKAEGGAAPG